MKSVECNEQDPHLCVGDQLMLRTDLEADDVWSSGHHTPEALRALIFAVGDVFTVESISLEDDGDLYELSLAAHELLPDGNMVGINLRPDIEYWLFDEFDEYFVGVQLPEPPHVRDFLELRRRAPPGRPTPAAVAAALGLINRHRAMTGQAPLDPAAAGWQPEDVLAEAHRLRTNPRAAERQLRDAQQRLADIRGALRSNPAAETADAYRLVEECRLECAAIQTELQSLGLTERGQNR